MFLNIKPFFGIDDPATLDAFLDIPLAGSEEDKDMDKSL